MYKDAKEKHCNKPIENGTDRILQTIPYMVDMDPFIEYMGYIYNELYQQKS